MLNKIIARRFSTKVFPSALEATKDIKTGDTLLVGGFGLVGIPSNLIAAILKHKPMELTCVSDSCGVDDWGLGQLLYQKQIKMMRSSYVGANKEFQRQYLSGELMLELTPQGSLAEKLRCGGAGIPGFYTKTGVDTMLQHGGLPIRYNPDGTVAQYSEPKESKVFNHKEYILEESITGEFALVKAWRADEAGNLQFRKSARNFNIDCAQAGQVCIAEVEEIVPVGTLDPDQIHLPSVYVDRIVLAEDKTKRIEDRTVNTGKKIDFEVHEGHNKEARERIARRAAKEMKNGMYVNLGIGIPTLVPNFVEEGTEITLQSENGFLGMGPFPKEEDVDPDLINAGKQTVSILPGGAFFHSSQSFAMIRGKHLDLSILGGMEVSERGDLANWVIPGKLIKGLGGAMDLVHGAKRLIVTMEHQNKKGMTKVYRMCDLPLTGKEVVDMLITDKAVFEFSKKTRQMVLTEIAENTTLEEVKAATEAKFVVADQLKRF